MNKRQIITLNMFKSVDTYLDENKLIWEDVVPIAEGVALLHSNIEKIEEKAQLQEEKGSTGYTADKQNKLEILVEEALSICLKIRPYAKKKKDEVLLVMVDYSKSSLEAGADVDVLNRCKIILEKAKENKNDLAIYKLTDADITALEKAIEEAGPLTAKRDNVQGQRSQVTSELVDLFAGSHQCLDVLDDLIPGIFNKTNREFVATYQNTRKINDRTGRHAKPDSNKKKPVNVEPTSGNS